MGSFNKSAVDMQYMRYALSLARRGLGRTWPNPSVGCVVVNRGRIIGAARTADGGRPHAETQALKQAGALSKGATVYVTLEPCAHTGKTSPCAQALIDAGVAHVVIACIDPNEQVNGRGIMMLENAGIKVTTDVCRDKARTINAGFFKRVSQKIEQRRPHVTLKIATSLDGKIALGNGTSQWITGPRARAHVHMLRSQHDAVLTGMGTVLKDDPQLTARIPGLLHRTTRVVLDTALRMPKNAALFCDVQTHPLYIFHGPDVNGKSYEGVRYITVSKRNDGGLDLSDVLQKLAEEGFTRIMVEAGAQIFTSFFNAGLWDDLYWYRAPKMIGNDGIAAFAGTGVQDMKNLARLDVQRVQKIGDDVLEIYKNTNSP